MDVYDYYITPDEYAEAERNGIDRERLNHRIRSGAWDKNRAIIEPKQIHKDRSHMKRVWVNYGIPYDLFRSRLHVGWDEWSAAIVPIRNSGDVLEHCAWMSELRHKYPGDIVKLATTNGIPYQIFVHRIKKGWSYELASTLPPSPSNSAMILKQKYGEDYHRNSNEMGVRQNKEVEKRADLLCFVNPDPEINFQR